MKGFLNTVRASTLRLSHSNEEMEIERKSNRSLVGDVFRGLSMKGHNSVCSGFDYAQPTEVKLMRFDACPAGGVQKSVAWECSRNIMKGVNSLQCFGTMLSHELREWRLKRSRKSKCVGVSRKLHEKGVETVCQWLLTFCFTTDIEEYGR